VSDSSQGQADAADAAEGDAAGVGIGSRWFELGVALLLMAIGVIVIVDSQRVGTGWDEFDGPRSGYFPFYIGCLLLASSGWVALRQVLTWRRDSEVFARSEQLGRVWAIVWPMAVYVALVQPLGIYVSSLLLIAFFMRRHGKYAWAKLSAVAVGVPLFFFLVFERWFLVALPKGPIEAWLGF
jgi:hypothetical protein